jgi:hypothetical protein
LGCADPHQREGGVVSRLTQNARILARLQHCGCTSQHEWLAPVVDGGSQVYRLPSRIDELRNLGYEIKTTRRPGRVALYTLVTTPVPKSAGVDTVSNADTVPTLLEVPAEQPRPASPYEVD